ncbi:hypothetical protein ES703_80883 [subsurface metagenome]
MVQERRAPTTSKVQQMIEGGGGANVKSGTKAANTGANSVTFNTPFASVPGVVLTVQDTGVALRDCLYKVTSVSTTGFDFEADVAATYAWIATDAGN